jgi:hypothetical protein
MAIDNLLFIVGPTRSGSKIYQNALNNIEGVEVFNTLHFLRPKWVGNDFVRISKQFGSLKKDENLSKLVEQIFSKKLLTSPSGTFWSSDALDSINRDRLISRLRASSRNPKIFLDILLMEIIKSRNINMLGIRAPMHIAYAVLLRRLYPSSKILFIIRDPRAILISSIKKNAKYKLRNAGILARTIMYIKRFFYVLFLFRISMLQNRFFIGDDNFKLIRFEDLLDDEVGVFQEICSFLDLEFSEKILDIPHADSSYTKIGSISSARGINKELGDKWREHMHPLVNHLLKIFLKKEMKYFGYRI